MRQHRHGPVSVPRPTTLLWRLGQLGRTGLASAAEGGVTVIDSGGPGMAELAVVQRAAVITDGTGCQPTAAPEPVGVPSGGGGW